MNKTPIEEILKGFDSMFDIYSFEFPETHEAIRKVIIQAYNAGYATASVNVESDFLSCPNCNPK